MSLPLATLFAEGGAGCNLLTTPDVVELLVTTTGTAPASILLAESPTLLGSVIYHQMVPFELHGSLQFAEITVTNSLALTVGGF